MQLVAPDGTTLQAWQEALDLDDVVISPSGDAIAYLQENKITLWRQDGSVTTIQAPEGLYIGSLDWGQMSAQFGAEYEDDSCPCG